MIDGGIYILNVMLSIDRLPVFQYRLQYNFSFLHVCMVRLCYLEEFVSLFVSSYSGWLLSTR